jgi:hypothetical protein
MQSHRGEPQSRRLFPSANSPPARRSFAPEAAFRSSKRQSYSVSGQIKFLIASAVAAPLFGYLLLLGSPQQINVETVPQPPTGTARTEFSSRSMQRAAGSTIKPKGSEADPESLLTFADTDKWDRSGMAEPIRAPKSDSAAPAVALAPPGPTPIIEREAKNDAPAAQESTCFPSASGVRQDHPAAWPSWTMRAPGHEGTKCWYPATRATAHDHQSGSTSIAQQSHGK